MKLQRTPLVLLLTALLLGGFVYFYEIQGTPKREETQAATEALFSFKEEEVQTLEVTTQTQTLSFVKAPSSQRLTPQNSGANAPSQASLSQWSMTAPTKAPASDASVTFLLNLMATGKSQQTIAVASAKQAEFGLDKPLAIVDVKLANQQTHRLVLGKPNYNRSALYAQIDPSVNPKSDLSVRLVAIDFENAVSRSLPDWQAKPPTAEAKPNKKSDIPPSPAANSPAPSPAN